MNIDDLTLGQVKEIQSLVGNQPAQKAIPFKVGEKWLFRTVTHIDTGEIVSIHGDLVVLKNAAWVADTGRFSDSLRNSVFDEVEPYTNECVINIGSLVDATKINTLPSEQK